MTKVLAVSWVVLVRVALHQGLLRRTTRVPGQSNSSGAKCKECGRSLPSSGICATCSNKQKPRNRDRRS